MPVRTEGKPKEKWPLQWVPEPETQPEVLRSRAEQGDLWIQIRRVVMADGLRWQANWGRGKRSLGVTSWNRGAPELIRPYWQGLCRWMALGDNAK